MRKYEVGSKKKREIAFVLVSFLDKKRRYSAHEIEYIVRQSVKAQVLNQPGLAPDHIRRAMIENGYVRRDPITNQTWVSETFSGVGTLRTARLRELSARAESSPEETSPCPLCGEVLKAPALLKHYSKKHSADEEWKNTLDAYFGQS